MVTWGEAYLGVIGPFPVSIPWWSEVEPVVARLHQVLDVPVLVLRLLLVEGGEGGRDGHVTYHVAALNRPAPGLLAERPVDQAALTRPEDLRSPWAQVEGIREVLSWASDTLGAAGRRVTGPAVQRKTWNLSALFRLPTADGPVWLKAVPGFAAAGRPRSPRSPRSTRTWSSRPGQRAGPPAACRRPRHGLLGRLAAGRGGRRAPTSRRAGRASASRRTPT